MFARVEKLLVVLRSATSTLRNTSLYSLLLSKKTGRHYDTKVGWGRSDSFNMDTETCSILRFRGRDPFVLHFIFITFQFPKLPGFLKGFCCLADRSFLFNFIRLVPVIWWFEMRGWINSGLPQRYTNYTIACSALLRSKRLQKGFSMQARQHVRTIAYFLNVLIGFPTDTDSCAKPGSQVKPHL